MDNLTVNNNPLLIVLSGPSGVGKDAVLNKMKCVCQNFHFTVTATTRPKRKGEVDGKDYIFLSRDDFEEKLKTGSDWFDFSIINEDDGIEDVVNQIILICTDIQSNNKSKEYFHD